MKHSRHKFVAVALTLLLIVAIVPTTVLADESTPAAEYKIVSVTGPADDVGLNAKECTVDGNQLFITMFNYNTIDSNSSEALAASFDESDDLTKTNTTINFKPTAAGEYKLNLSFNYGGMNFYTDEFTVVVEEVKQETPKEEVKDEKDEKSEEKDDENEVKDGQTEKKDENNTEEVKGLDYFTPFVPPISNNDNKADDIELITEEEIPLTIAPEDGSSNASGDGEEIIEDEQVALADATSAVTGDYSFIWVFVAILATLGLAAIAFTGKNKND